MEELVGELKPRSGTFLSRPMTPRVCSRSVSSSEVFWSVMYDETKKSKTRKSKKIVVVEENRQQLRKKVLFYFQKLKSVPVTRLRRKSLQVLRFSHDLIRLFHKKLKKFHKKIIFSMILLAIILLPLKYPIWIMAKLRQFSHFLQQINKWASRPFSKIQTRAPSLFPFVRCANLLNRKLRSNTPIKYDWEGREYFVFFLIQTQQS